MKICKIINNNIVSAVDDYEREVVVMGRGLGFGVKVGAEVDPEKIEKVFRMDSDDETQRLIDLLNDMPLEYIQLANQIIKNAKAIITDKLQRSIYITLTDHIYFAIQRYQQNIKLSNPILYEIRRFYPHEFQVGKDAVILINRSLKIELPEDEAASIALHFINAEFGREMKEVFDMAKLIQNVVKIVKYNYSMEFKEDSLNFEQFIHCLKFMAERIVYKKEMDQDDPVFLRMVQTLYPEAFRCAERIREYIKKEYYMDSSSDEVAYLTVHIERITTQALAKSEN